MGHYDSDILARDGVGIEWWGGVVEGQDRYILSSCLSVVLLLDVPATGVLWQLTRILLDDDACWFGMAHCFRASRILWVSYMSGGRSGIIGNLH